MDRIAEMRRSVGIAVLALLVAGVASAQAPAETLHGESGRFTTSDGVRLHYLEAGSGPSLVFVPGWTMPAEIWEEQIRHFSGSHRVVAIDPRSQGRSEKVAEGHFPERRARDIHEVVEGLGLAPAILVGWSLAVPELLTYVEEFGTESIRALVLVDGFIGEDPDPEASAQFREMLRAVHHDRGAFTTAFVRGMYRSERSEGYLRRITEASLRTPTNTAFTLLAHLMVTDLDWRPALGKVDRPLLYVVTPQLEAQADMVRRTVPGARVEVFRDAGHALFVDEAARFNALLESFMENL